MKLISKAVVMALFLASGDEISGLNKQALVAALSQD